MYAIIFGAVMNVIAMQIPTKEMSGIQRGIWLCMTDSHGVDTLFRVNGSHYVHFYVHYTGEVVYKYEYNNGT